MNTIVIADILKEYNKPKEQKGRKEQERDAPFNELYSLYTSVTQKELRRIENWKRYILWLKAHKIKHSKESVQKFRKTKSVSKLYIKGASFISELDVRGFAVKISHIKTDQLYYCLSIARDKDHRGEPINAWLFQKPK